MSYDRRVVSASAPNGSMAEAMSAWLLELVRLICVRTHKLNPKMLGTARSKDWDELSASVYGESPAGVPAESYCMLEYGNGQISSWCVYREDGIDLADKALKISITDNPEDLITFSAKVLAGQS